HRGYLLWLLPLIILFWVNIHGGFLVGFVLLGIYWLGAVWTWCCGRDDRFDDFLLRVKAARQAKMLTLVGLTAAAATLFNPYGWSMHVHIYQYLSNRFLIDHIDEFRSPNFHGVAERCFVVLLLIAFVALARRARELRLTEVLVVLFAVYSGLYASRNIP